MALASMSEIFERMARNGQEFWEVVLADDMDERQVSREASCGGQHLRLPLERE